MGSLLRSKIVAWLALLIVVAVIIITFEFRTAWWGFIDVFFAFMMVFSQLVALYIGGFNPYAAKKLQSFAAIFLILAILAFVGEFIAYWILFY